jgi:hypothetical protein
VHHSIPTDEADERIVMTANRFDRVAAGLAMIAAGPVILAGLLTSVWEKNDSLAAYLQSYLIDPDRSQISALLLHIGYLLLVPILLGLAIVSHTRPRLRAAGLTLGLLGGATLPGLLVIDFYDMALAHTLPIGQGVAVEEQVSRYWGTLAIFLPTMAGLVLGMTLLGIAAWRAGFAPWWSMLPFLAGFITTTVSRGGHTVTIIGIILMTAGLIDLGRRMITSAGRITDGHTDNAHAPADLGKRADQYRQPSEDTALPVM